MSLTLRVAAALTCLATFLAPDARGDAPGPAQCAVAYADAQLSRQHGHLLAARESARSCAMASCPAVGRKDCATWSAELDREIPSLVVVARDAATGSDFDDARVAVDGVARPDMAGGHAIELDPGPHLLRVDRAGSDSAALSITLLQGERDRIVRIPLHAATPAAATSPAAEPNVTPAVTPAPPAPAGPRRSYVPAAITAGVSVAALGASAVLGLTGRNDLSNLHSTCAPWCRDDQVNPVRARLVASDIALGVGALAAGLSIYFFVRPPVSEPATTVGIGPGTVALQHRF